MPEIETKETVNISLVAVLGAIGAILLFVLIVGLQVLYYNFERKQTEEKVVVQLPEEVARLRADQEAELNAYRWIDREKGTLGIPIERAMELVIRESSAPPPDTGGTQNDP